MREVFRDSLGETAHRVYRAQTRETAVVSKQFREKKTERVSRTDDTSIMVAPAQRLIARKSIDRRLATDNSVVSAALA